MNEDATTGYRVEIDGKPHPLYYDLDSAKQAAVCLAKGASSMKITTIRPVGMAASAWYWDYEIGEWVFAQNAVLAIAKKKGEQGNSGDRI
ncbi:MAG: hypothetical protein FD157_3144 [Rhodocyclaceae bacterium]|jgi:hypothetical protein|nr:MAG: hypothetical protein FD157_3144 [Rhodocyclaceae bacterium]TND00458.1 MAG: hypothetical protein FD118_3159 [Rhodocyclaceae bacterium]